MAHGFQNKLDAVRDSIASLFKRRKSSGRSKNESRISTPQNVKRVMHITFDPGNQSFEGIPANWRNYFEGQQMSKFSSAEAAAQEVELPVEDEYAAVYRSASRKMEHTSTPVQHAAPEDEYAVIECTRPKSSVEVPPKMAGLVANHTAEDHRGWGHATEGLAIRGHDNQDRVSWKYETNSNSHLQPSCPGYLRLEDSQECVIAEDTDHLAERRPQNAAAAHPSDGTAVHSEEHPAHAITHMYGSTEHSEEHFTHSAINHAEHPEGQAEHPQAEHPENASTQEASELALGDLTLTEPASGDRAVLDDHAGLEVEPRRAHLSAFDKADGASADAPARVESQPLKAPRELLSLVYDRDNGRFVNLPPHWEERLVRNNLLEPEFHTNPRLLALVFGMMDQELRTMRAEGERVESCMYSSTLPARSQSRSRESRPYVFRIEADKSNSSSETDLSLDQHAVRQQQQQQQQEQEHQQQHQQHQRQPTAAQRPMSTIDAQFVKGSRQRKLQRGSSFVVIKAVEVPNELDKE